LNRELFPLLGLPTNAICIVFVIPMYPWHPVGWVLAKSAKLPN
jgi:hypothetical protein